MNCATGVQSRIEGIDWLRGLVMILMALDHVRDHFHASAQDPTADLTSSAMLFATRWVTHICAPTFVLLAGVSAGIMAERRGAAQAGRFLVTRGVWLIVLEVTVVTFAWKFNFGNSPGIILQVIWAIGVSMLLLALLVRLPQGAVLALGLVIVVGSSLWDGCFPCSSMKQGVPQPLWMALHRQILWAPRGLLVLFAYPVVVWFGVMACGYAMAGVFKWDPRSRRRFLWTLGATLLMLFLLLRGFRLYGDPSPWETGETWGETLKSFLAVQKYPPSPLFLAVTLGLTVPLMGIIEKWPPPGHKVLITIGRVPLFYYVLHLYLIHLAVMVSGLFQGLTLSDWCVFFEFRPAGAGFGLGAVYLAWAGVVLTLYPACRWFAGVKARRRDWWLSYL